MDRAQQILSFIEDELLDDPDVEVKPDTSLFQDRVLDSLNLVQLIGFLEKTFNVKIGTSEVTIDNLDSINNMIRFLDKKTS